MNEDLLERIATLLAAYRDLDRAALPTGTRDGIRKILDAYAETIAVKKRK